MTFAAWCLRDCSVFEGLRLRHLIFFVLFLAASSSVAQQAGATGEPLIIETVSPAKAFLRQEYRFALHARGGINPLRWEVTSGSMPDGIELSQDGLLTGIPKETGEFVFTATVSDSGKPPRQKAQQLTLLVTAPLHLQWSRYPLINGQRIEFAIKLSNETGEDFDLTLIAMAVNDIGRATAVGYEHFRLRMDTEDMEIPISESLPPGIYELDVDAVAEIPEKNTIYRSRLVARQKLVVQSLP